MLSQNRGLLAFILLFFIGIFLRFYNLSWGQPYFFHPDERNIASSISQLSFSDQLNPRFFAYGSLPIYVIFFTGIFINFTQSVLQQTDFSKTVTFEQAILISRFYSAMLSMLLLPFLYSIGVLLHSRSAGVFAVLLGIFNVGFVQFAHFGTFEMWLTFLLVLLLWVFLRFQKKLFSLVILSGLILGILLSIKISSAVFFPLPVLPLFYCLFLHPKPVSFHIKRILLFGVSYLVIFLVAGVVFIITNPYVLLDFASFRGSIDYESSVGLGTLPVFYTSEFVNTVPILFQLRHVLPFLLNPFLTLLFIPFLFYFIYLLFRRKNFGGVLLLFFLLVTFLSQAFLYVKWVRYLVPSIPFILLIFSLSFVWLFKKREQYLWTGFVGILLVTCIYGLSFFITTYVEQDTRLAAFSNAKLIIPSDSRILSEVYDLGIIPFNERYPSISLFNFYDLDNSSPDYNEETLSAALDTSEYIILPSQRVYKSRLLKPNAYPIGEQFYKQLFSGELGFEKVYETPCSIFCQIAFLGDPAFSYEQTASVFDRPVVMIFQKQ
jgi:4-amino-4-deoxy-L-arabinose transferase-like glycosyltransferase